MIYTGGAIKFGFNFAISKQLRSYAVLVDADISSRSDASVASAKS